MAITSCACGIVGAANTGWQWGDRDVPWEAKISILGQWAVLGKYPAAACLLLHGKIRSKKQLVPPYLHGVNSLALQWIPRQAHRPSRKSSKQWEKHSTLFLDKRPPQLLARCRKRQQRKEWWQRLKWGLHSPAWGCWQRNPTPRFSGTPRELPLWSPEPLQHLPMVPTELPKRPFSQCFQTILGTF